MHEEMTYARLERPFQTFCLECYQRNKLRNYVAPSISHFANLGHYNSSSFFIATSNFHWQLRSYVNHLFKIHLLNDQHFTSKIQSKQYLKSVNKLNFHFYNKQSSTNCKNWILSLQRFLMCKNVSDLLRCSS